MYLWMMEPPQTRLMINVFIVSFLALLVNLVVGVLGADNYSRDDFPLDFVFGLGTSAYQVPTSIVFLFISSYLMNHCISSITLFICPKSKNKYILWWNYIMATNVNFFSHCKIHFVLKYYFIVWKKFKLYGMHVYLQESEREILCDFVHPCLCVWFCLYMRAYVSVIFHAVLYGKEINHGW